MMLIAWIVLAVAFIVAELFTLDLTLGIIGGSAAAAGVSTVAGAPLPVQMGVFALFSLLGLGVLRPIAKRHLMRRPKEIRTGVDRLPGSQALALEAISADGGLIKLDGETWSAKLDTYISEEPIPAGARVTVIRIEGATAFVHIID
jgi:membrane protein implicated in regulation of membrane protease activity